MQSLLKSNNFVHKNFCFMYANDGYVRLRFQYAYDVFEKIMRGLARTCQQGVLNTYILYINSFMINNANEQYVVRLARSKKYHFVKCFTCPHYPLSKFNPLVPKPTSPAPCWWYIQCTTSSRMHLWTMGYSTMQWDTLLQK